MPKGKNELSKNDSIRLERLCEVVTNNLDSARKVWEALHEIKESRLYRAEAKTFEEFCANRWQFTRQWANGLARAAAGARCLPDDVPISARAAIELERVPEEQRQEVVAAMQDQGLKVTAANVRATVEAMAEPDEPCPEAEPDIPEDEPEPDPEFVDGLNVPVPDELVEVWRSASALDDLAKLVRQVSKQAQAAAETPGGAYLRMELVRSCCRELLNHLKACRPFCQVPLAMRDDPSFEVGWVSEGQYRVLSKTRGEVA